MKTEEWISALAAGTESVDPRAPARRLLLATLAGAALALPLMLGLLGLNPRLATASQTPMFWVKLAFVVTTAAAAIALLHRLARPGVPIQRNAIVLAMPFAAIWLLAAGALIASAATERLPLLLGSTWSACPLNIAMLSAPALVLMLWALRSLAPTRLRLAGGAAGLLAGSVGATVYTLHCPEMAAPFIGVWYVLGMVIPAALGAALGRRMLRW
jgi:hypothetical protein